MKAIFEFDFDKEDEKATYKVYSNANELYCALHDIQNEVRGIWKYRDLGDEAAKVVDEIYESICNRIGNLLEE